MRAPNNYLVPFDFEEKSKNALFNALILAKQSKGEVYLLHVVDNHIERFKKLQQLNEIRSELSQDEQEIVNIRVITGNLIDDLDKTAELLNIKLVILSYENESKFSALFNNTEVKMISASHVPYLVVNKDVTFSKVDKIVFPFNYHTESIQIAKFLSKFAKQQEAKIYMVGSKLKDSVLSKKAAVNRSVLSKVFSDAGIPYEIKLLEEGASFEQSMIDFAKEINADVLSATDYETGFFINPHTFLKKLLENEYKIPLIVINADEYSHASEQYSFIGT